MLKRLLILAILPLVIAACDERSSRDDANFISVPPDDKEMNAAIAEARARLPEFLAALQRGGTDIGAFSIKAKYEMPSGAEYIWVGAVTYNGKTYSGRLDNVPHYIKGLKHGDAVLIEPEAISDWFYVEDGRLVGGYTIRVIYKRMPPAQQQAFRQQLPFKLD